MVGAVYLDYNPTETRSVIETETESVNINVQTKSELSEDTVLFEDKDTIEGPVYFNDSNPELDVVYEVETEREIETDINLDVTIVGEEDGFNFWDEKIEIEEKNDLSIEDEYTGNASIDVGDIKNRSEDVREEFNRQGSVTTNIQYRVDYSNDEYSGTVDKNMTFIFREDTYSVLPPKLEETENQRIRTVTGTEEVGDQTFINGGFLAAGIGLLFFIVRFVIANPNRVRKDYMLARFGDWISTTVGERDDANDSIIELDECEDIVDVAADTDGRVIYYKSSEELVVHGTNRCYLYKLTEEELSKVRFGLLESNDKDSSDDDDSYDNDSSSENTGDEDSEDDGNDRGYFKFDHF